MHSYLYRYPCNFVMVSKCGHIYRIDEASEPLSPTRGVLGVLLVTFLFNFHRQIQRADALMGEVVNVLVAFAVIVFIFRWVTSGTLNSSSSDSILDEYPTRFLFFLQFVLGSDSTGQRTVGDSLGFRPNNVTQEMVRLSFLGSSGEGRHASKPMHLRTTIL